MATLPSFATSPNALQELLAARGLATQNPGILQSLAAPPQQQPAPAPALQRPAAPPPVPGAGTLQPAGPPPAPLPPSGLGAIINQAPQYAPGAQELREASAPPGAGNFSIPRSLGAPLTFAPQYAPGAQELRDNRFQTLLGGRNPFAQQTPLPPSGLQLPQTNTRAPQPIGNYSAFGQSAQLPRFSQPQAPQVGPRAPSQLPRFMGR